MTINVYVIAKEKYQTKVYIMDMMDTNNIDIDKYADYHIQLNQWFHPSDKAIMSKCVKSEIAKHFINCKDVYDDVINMINDEPIGFIEHLYFDFVNDYKYFDERIMKNKIYETDDTFSDTNTNISIDNDYSLESDHDDYDETDDDSSDDDEE